MLYTDLLRFWDEAVKAVDARDWPGALSKLDQITEPTSRTLFVSQSVHLALGQVELAIKALDETIEKDERLAVGFFQRAGAKMMANRLEEALGDCVRAQKHMRQNPVIDYRQLGLRYKLYSWQVLYNAAAVHSGMGQWDKARDILTGTLQERGAGRGGGTLELGLESISRREVLEPLLLPEGVVFRPRKQEVEQLKQRDFLGKAKVITSVIPNDDFGGFEPLRMQKPGFYEPSIEGSQDSHYMCLKNTYLAQGPGELTAPSGGLVFVLSDADRNGMTTVIHDGQKGLLPVTMLEPVDVKKTKRKMNKGSVPNGIPLPPGSNPPTRPQNQTSLGLQGTDALPCYIAAIQPSPPPPYTTSSEQGFSSAQSEEPHGSLAVKVHYRYTVSLCVPPDTPYGELQQKIAHKLGQPATQLRLRHKQQGTQVLRPLDKEEGLKGLAEVAESGRVTLWCQNEDPLFNRPILYQMVALYDYAAQGPEDLEFSEGDTIDVLSEVNEEWLEGHAAGSVGIFPRCFAYRETGQAGSSEAGAFQ
ncbi:NADPH oxidase activator 1 isoform X2 [Denticeps clupeoides]|nr:NADPH oxidase activator 1 isoform X2 [Denticeps clupeoides]